MALTKITPQMFDTSAAGHDFNIDNGTFVVDASANRVGIGTTTPLDKLDVGGSLRISDGALTFDKPSVYGFQFLHNDAGNDLSIRQGDANNANYVTRLNINSSGNVGIGTSSPTSKLHVYDGSMAIESPSGSGGHYLILNNTDTGGRDYRLISTSNAHGSLGGGDFSILDHDVSGNDADRTRLLIDSSGSIGIGTTTPSSFNALADDLVVGTTSGSRGITIVGATNGHSSLYFADGTSGASQQLAGFVQYTHGTDALLFGTAATEAMRILSDGKVGIGTNNPGSALHVDKANVGSALVTFHQTSGNSSADRGLDVETSSTGTTVQRWLNSGTELARISGTGIFSLYSQRLEISNAGDTKATFIRSNNTVSLAMATTASGGYGFYDNSRGGYDLYMKNGTVGIGNNNTSPASTLDVAGGITIDAPANTTPLTIQCATDAYNYATIRNAANNIVGYFGVGSALVVGTSTNDFALRSQSGAFCFSQGGSSERMRIDTSGNLLLGKQSSNFDNTGVEIRGGGEVIITRANDLLHLNRISSDGTIVTFRRGSTSTVGSIFVTTSGTSYFTTSDRRLKENIVDASSASDDIDAIQVRSFDWKSNGLHQKYGMIAQELLPVAPEAVGHPEDSEKMMSIDYSKLVPMLVKEIQSLRTRVAQLEEEK